MDTSQPEITILWENKENHHLYPLDLLGNVEWIASCLKRRTIPKNRAFVYEFLSKKVWTWIVRWGLFPSAKVFHSRIVTGLSKKIAQNPLKISIFLKIVSTEHWLLPHLLAQTAINEILSSQVQNLPQMAWRERGFVSLWKGATSGASNTGYEPYSEFYAYQYGKELGFPVVPYTLKKWKGQLSSVCPLFTSKETSFTPIGFLVKSGGMEAVEAYYQELGEEFALFLQKMFILDALICNTDRHFDNYGVLIDNEIIALAPLFDHGNSLFNFAGTSCWENITALEKYEKTLLPSVYGLFK